MRSALLSDWQTIRGSGTTSVVQSSDDWLEVGPYADVVFWIDVIEVSHDNGKQWNADDTLLALASDESTGTVVASGALNAAGVEPTGAAIFKSGPHNGPTLMRCARLTGTGGGTTWVTGAPQVIAIKVG